MFKSIQSTNQLRAHNSVLHFMGFQLSLQPISIASGSQHFSSAASTSIGLARSNPISASKVCNCFQHTNYVAVHITSLLGPDSCIIQQPNLKTAPSQPFGSHYAAEPTSVSVFFSWSTARFIFTHAFR